MQFLEENTDFIDLNDEEDDEFIATCFECKAEFQLKGDEEPVSCPACKIKFL